MGINNLEKLDLGNGVKSIGAECIISKKLTSLVFPESLESLDFCAVLLCPELKEITLPDKPLAFGAYVFEHTAYYDDPANWDNGMLYIGNHLMKVDAEKYAIENGFEFIDLESIEEPKPPVDPSEGCTCRCHKDGFENFIYKILRIFWKIFKINEDCVCGAKHY